MSKGTRILALAAVVVWVGCGPQGGSGQPQQVQPDSNSGGDDSLPGARGVFDEAVNDSVDATTGDNTDMKYVDIDARGTLDVRVRLHSPDVGGSVALLNEYGDVLREQQYNAGATDVVIEHFDVLPGRYFIRITANRGKSDYTVGRTFTRDPTWMSDEDRQWRDQQVELAHSYIAQGRFDDARQVLNAVKQRFPQNTDVVSSMNTELASVDRAEQDAQQAAAAAAEEERQHHTHTHTRHDTTQQTTTQQTTTPEETTTTTPTETTATEPEARNVRANIVTVRDLGSGTGTSLILTGCGSSSGLSVGDTGTIGSTSHHAHITRITGGNSCEAESTASRGEIGAASVVTF